MEQICFQSTEKKNEVNHRSNCNNNWTPWEVGRTMKTWKLHTTNVICTDWLYTECIITYDSYQLNWPKYKKSNCCLFWGVWHFPFIGIPKKIWRSQNEMLKQITATSFRIEETKPKIIDFSFFRRFESMVWPKFLILSHFHGVIILDRPRVNHKNY